MVAQIELRIGNIEMNFRFDVAESVYQIIEQREESQKKGKKGKKPVNLKGVWERARWRCEAAKRKREKKRVCGRV